MVKKFTFKRAIALATAIMFIAVNFIAFSITSSAETVSDSGFETVQLVTGADADSGDSTGGSTGGGDAEATFEVVVMFFVTWIGRIGLLVAFVGAIMFGLAIKNSDAEQKQAGLLTLAAGFVVFAVCQAVDMFNIFA